MTVNAVILGSGVGLYLKHLAKCRQCALVATYVLCTSNFTMRKNGDHPIMGAEEIKDTDGMQCRGIGYNEI